MKLLIINGPNLNMLGLREVNLYGTTTYRDLKKQIINKAHDLKIKVKIVQSNYEGKIVTYIQKALHRYDGIIINGGAYTHTSIAILDALKAVNIPTIEVHLTDIYKREEYRHKSYLGEACFAHYIGMGIEGYLKALEIFKEKEE